MSDIRVITIQTERGPRQTQVDVVSDHFAVRRESRDTMRQRRGTCRYAWRITHVASGCAVGREFRTYTSARRFAMQLESAPFPWEAVTTENALNMSGPFVRGLVNECRYP
jgi:hypothetical protein